MKNYISIPENFYCIADEHTKVILPNIITCMGICITSNDNRKIVVHCADGEGFPIREITEEKHPLPKQYHPYQSKNSTLFKFLLSELGIDKKDIKNVSIFGNYRIRKDLFRVGMHVYITESLVADFIAKEFEISSDLINIYNYRNVAIGIDLQGKVLVLPSSEDVLERMLLSHSDYFRFMKNKPFNIKLSDSALGIFEPKRISRKYSKDDMDLIDLESPGMKF